MHCFTILFSCADSQKPALNRAIRPAGSYEDLLKVKGRVVTKQLPNGGQSDKNLLKLIDPDRNPLKVTNVRDDDGVKTKTTYYSLKDASSETLLKVEYSSKAKSKHRVFLATDRSEIPTHTDTLRSFHALHEYFRRCIIESLPDAMSAEE